jgi:hypothetical protein
MTITTLNLIGKQTVGAAGTASVTFSNIPQTYTDLKVVVSARHSAAEVSNDILVSFNGSTSNFTARRLYGSGSGTGGDTNARSMGTTVGASATASTFANNEIYIPNYTSSNYKSYSTDQVGENNATQAYTILVAGLWSDVAAITSITLTAAAGSFVQYSTFTLYGVSSNTTTQNATVPYAKGGNIIATDGSYWYHQFLSSGTFTPLKAITCDYLVVAGGGAGGYYTGGGGGAGGYRTSIGGTPLTLSLSTNYTVTVGGGGAPSNNHAGISGNNSVFSTITSTGGGGGAGYTAITGYEYAFTGGSGGGGTSANSGEEVGAAGNTPSTSPAQGFAGGNGNTAPYYNAGGGGGSSAVGSNATTTFSGAGGSGTSNSISGSSLSYAGGGGGGGVTGAGGTATSGGGAGGAASTAGTAATANTGGGGGGGGSGQVGAAGGSGIVIVRYAV